MNEHAVRNSPTAPTQFPGVAPVQGKTVTKLGTLEVVPPKVSLPQRLLQSVKTALHLGKPEAPPPKLGLPPLPLHAHVTPATFKALDGALQQLAEAKAKGTPTEQQQAASHLSRLVSGLLVQVYEGTADGQLPPDMQDAVQRDDPQAFVAALRKELVGRQGLDRQDAIGQLFDSDAAPVVSEKIQYQGRMNGPRDAPVQLQPKQHTDAHQLPEAHLQDLPLTDLQREKAIALFQELGGHLQNGDTPAVDEALGRLATLLRESLDNVTTSPQTKLAFTLSDGKAFMKELSQAIVGQASPDSKVYVQLELDHFMEPFLRSTFDQMVSGVLDKALKIDASGVPTEIEVDGRRYVRDQDSALASGNFGEVWVYTNPEDPSDRVAMKRPLGTDAKDRHHRVDEPLAEGQMAVQVMGTGASAATHATLLGVIRTGDQVNLVFRFEPGGGLHDTRTNPGAMNKIDTHLALSPDPDVAQGKLALMLDLILGVQHMGEAKGVVHLDVAVRNLLLDDKGHLKITDYGLAQPLPESAPLDQGEVTKDRSRPSPVQWMPPELLQGDQSKASAKSDVYSVGATMLQMVLGMTKNLPPWRMTNPQYIEAHQKGTWDPEKSVPDPLPSHAWPGVDMQALRALIVRMVDADPAKRPTLGEVASSPVFANIKPEHREALVQVLNGTRPRIDNGAQPEEEEHTYEKT